MFYIVYSLFSSICKKKQNGEEKQSFGVDYWSKQSNSFCNTTREKCEYSGFGLFKVKKIGSEENDFFFFFSSLHFQTKPLWDRHQNLPVAGSSLIGGGERLGRIRQIKELGGRLLVPTALLSAPCQYNHTHVKNQSAMLPTSTATMFNTFLSHLGSWVDAYDC